MSAHLSPDSRWPTEVRERLDAMLDAIERAEQTDTEPPVAVFDFDNTCISNDIGEAFHLWMATHGRYRLEPGYALDELDPRDGRDEIVTALRRVEDAPHDEEARAHLRALVFATYQRHMAHAGKGPTYQWQLGLLAGLTLDDVDACSRTCIEDALAEEPGTEHIVLDGVDPIHIRHGFEIRPELVELVAALGHVGAEVWICSASMVWIVAPFAARAFGLPPQRVLAARTQVVDGVFTADPHFPTAYSGGKVELIDAHIGRRPHFTAGDSMTDFEMLRHTRDDGHVLVFDRDPKLSDHARAEGWILCPVLETL